MRNKQFAGILGILLFLCTLLTPLACSAADAQELLDGVLAYELAQDGADSVQDWLDGGLADNAGMTAEWYVLALSQDAENYDFSAYSKALDAYLAENTVTSAVTAQKYALAYLSVGGGEAYIAETMGNSIGEMGIMSWVW
ncbi:MAG: surface/cell-adhesion protein, partial [Oscillospiraceae bacterium]|nr:surface/cell-adhesion protein [Oscillospiraceae bacterium]